MPTAMHKTRHLLRNVTVSSSAFGGWSFQKSTICERSHSESPLVRGVVLSGLLARPRLTSRNVAKAWVSASNGVPNERLVDTTAVK